MKIIPQRTQLENSYKKIQEKIFVVLDYIESS
jgi:hypothetical protein